MEPVEEFLKALSALTAKYGIVVSGCGECGSPYLEKLDADYIPDGDLVWDVSTSAYVYKGRI